MSIVDLYDSIYSILSNDEQILDLLGLDLGSDNQLKDSHIQKRAKPPNLIDNLPLIAFYTPGGQRESKNDLVFNSTFVFDIYTQDDVDLAQRIAQRVLDLFDKKNNYLSGLATFDSFFLDSYESGAILSNTYCYTIALKISFSL